MCISSTKTISQQATQSNIKMKLLGWMHQKLRQKGPETLEDFTTGKPSLGDQDYPTKPSFSSRYRFGSFKQIERENEKSISEIDAEGVEEYFEEASLVFSNNFHGLLSIGTFGSESLNELETPIFATSPKKASRIKTEVTDYDLKIIGYELEKFLDAEAKEEGCNEASEGNSHVSTNTLSGEKIEGVDAEDYGNPEPCPLQGYLFGSSQELPETAIESKKEKTSLEELFQRAETPDENPKAEKRAQKSSMHLMEKMLKRLNVSSKGFSHSTAAVSTPKNKLQKVLRMFHRKIHPASSVSAGEFDESDRYNNENILHNNQCSSMHPDEDKRSPRGSSNNLNLPQHRVSGSIASKNREHWIKTDADYLVLER